MSQANYTNKESSYKLVSVNGTEAGGLGLETWVQKTADGYTGGSKRHTTELFTADEIAKGVAVDANLVRARLDNFLRTHPIDTGVFTGDSPTFLKPDTPRYDKHLDAMTKEIQSIALERAAATVYFHGHADRAPTTISEAQYDQSLRDVADLVSQGVTSRGTFTISANGSRMDYDNINTIDKRGLHGGFSLSALMEEKRDELEALGVSGKRHAAVSNPVVLTSADAPEEARAEPAQAANVPPMYSAHDARQLAKELRHNKDAVELVEGYLDSHGGKSKDDGKIGIGERGQFEKLLNAAGNAELEQIMIKLSTIKINASQPDGASPATQVIADATSRGPRSVG